MVELLGQLLVLLNVVLRLLDTDAIMLSNSVKLAEPSPQLFQLVKLSVPQRLSFLVLFLNLSKLFCQVAQSLSRVLNLFHHVGLTLLHNAVELLLTLQLIDFKLSFQLFLLFDFFFGCLEIPFQVEQEVGLLNHIKTTLQLLVLFHEVDNRLVSVLRFTISQGTSTVATSD